MQSLNVTWVIFAHARIVQLYLEKYPLQQQCNSWCTYRIHANDMFTVLYKFDKDAITFMGHLQTFELAKPIFCKFYVRI